MINLNETPEAILTMKTGGQCLLDGRTFVCHTAALLDEAAAAAVAVAVVVAVAVAAVDKSVYLTTIDSRIAEYERVMNEYENDHTLSRRGYPAYEKYITHVRVGRAAVVRRGQLLEAIKTGTYSIG